MIDVTVSGTTEYTTVKGDTWDSIAFDFYTEEKLASLIIKYNPLYADVVVFDAGTTLTVPIVEEDSETPDTAAPWRTS